VEHRYSRRRKVRIPVRIERCGRPVAAAVLCDVSDAGLGLEVEGGLGFRPADALSVRVPWEGRAVEIRGVVIHSAPGRLGLLVNGDLQFLSARASRAA